jgi:hypothetical protein
MKRTKFKEEQVVAILKEQVYAGPQTAHWLLPLSHKPSPSGKSQRAVSANAGFKNDGSYL